MVIIGYTHYWRGSANVTSETVKDIKRIVKESTVAIHGGLGTGAPEIGIGGVLLNGSQELNEDYETFAVGPEIRNFGFCKTARRPYDEVVTAILLRLTEDGLVVSSDGTREEWSDGYELFERSLGRKAPELSL